ncbi:MAG: hypothetical protein HUU15_08615, partial [Candidatus Brocadiae bacterium]|nr:hypothetical protein [Candidatus Brocadiia bacterium]
EATRRRHKARTGEDPPAQIGALHEMLDAEGVHPPPTADLPGSAPATDTRFLVRSTDAPPGESTLDALDEGAPDAIEPPTVILPPTDPGVNEARHRLLVDTAQEGRIAQRARDDIVATIRSLPPEEQNGALAGPIGEQLVKLDRLIEEGVRAQKELGIAPPPDPEVSTAVNRRTTSASLHRPTSSASRRFKGPAGEEITVPPSWLPVTPEMSPENPPPTAAPPPAPERALPKRRESIGGETWQEVGLPAPAAAGEHSGKPDTRRVERITLTLTDEERTLLAERQILEEMAIHEIMRSQQPTSQRAWEQGKERFFAPMRAKANRRLEDATPAPRRPGRD